MPIYRYKCKRCATITEVFCRVAERTETTVCEHCGEIASPILTLPAFTPRRWGDSHPETIFGQEVYNTTQEDKVLQEKGLVRIDDKGKDWYDTELDKAIGSMEAQAAVDKRITDLQGKGMTKADAITQVAYEETFRS